MQDTDIKNIVYRPAESDVKGHKIVEVTYRQNDKIVKRQVFMQDHADEDLVNETKRVIDYETSKGSLNRYSRLYDTNFAAIAKGIIIAVLSIGAFIALIFGIKIIYDRLRESYEFKRDQDEEEVREIANFEASDNDSLTIEITSDK